MLPARVPAFPWEDRSVAPGTACPPSLGKAFTPSRGGRHLAMGEDDRVPDALGMVPWGTLTQVRACSATPAKARVGLDCPAVAVARGQPRGRGPFILTAHTAARPQDSTGPGRVCIPPRTALQSPQAKPSQARQCLCGPHHLACVQ